MADLITVPTESLHDLVRTSLKLLQHATVLEDEAEARSAELKRTRAAALHYQQIVLEGAHR